MKVYKYNASSQTVSEHNSAAPFQDSLSCIAFEQ